MAATTRLMPPARRGMATGIVNAGGSFGQFVFAPIAQGVSAAAGWVAAVQTLAALSLLALPAAWVLRGPRGACVGRGADGSARNRARGDAPRAAPTRASGCSRSGFFVCGFHVAFIATHLPGVVASCQLPPAVGAWALAVIGLFNIVGSFAIGWAIGHDGGAGA